MRPFVFVSGNSNNAEMWQFEFDESVIARTMELTYSKSDAERAMTVSALEELRIQKTSTDKQVARIRKRSIELAEDPSGEVRWRVLFALKPDIAREEVRAIVDRLLDDPAPIVRLFSILADGKEKHIERLRELARCSDKKIAEFAQGHIRHWDEKLSERK